MEGERQQERRNADDGGAVEDELPAADAVIQVAEDGLANAVEQDAKGGGEGDAASAPVELFTHGEDEDADAVSGAHGHHNDEKGGGDDKPTVVDAGAPGVVHRRFFQRGWVDLCSLSRVAVTAQTSNKKAKMPTRHPESATGVYLNSETLRRGCCSRQKGLEGVVDSPPLPLYTCPNSPSPNAAVFVWRTIAIRSRKQAEGGRTWTGVMKRISGSA